MSVLKSNYKFRTKMKFFRDCTEHVKPSSTSNPWVSLLKQTVSHAKPTAKQYDIKSMDYTEKAKVHSSNGCLILGTTPQICG